MTLEGILAELRIRRDGVEMELRCAMNNTGTSAGFALANALAGRRQEIENCILLLDPLGPELISLGRPQT